EVTTSEAIRVKIDASRSYQQIFGFGGAFTDAAGIQLKRLSDAAQEQLLRTYYAQEGIEYSMGRVPIASTDFSTREYSYLDEPNDFELEAFNLAMEDYELKIPFILRAINLTQGQMRLFASPWSAPAWMKTNGHMKGGGQLKGEFNGPYYETYSKYFVRFFEEYFKEGVPFWGLTIENEPGAGLIADYEWQAMYLSNAMQKGFAEGLLGPAIRANPITQGLKIMAHDDQRDGIAVAAHEIYNKTTGPADYIDGLGVHWYSQSPFDTLTEAHNANPDKFILATEACTAYEKWEHAPILGHWERGEAYGHDIIQSILHWVTGWMDWNIALDETGGPNWVGNNVDSPIIVNNTQDEFYKQPMFYYLGHF
ncbi:O-glycosyl hydrolase family 30 protein, partial [Aphelenchoides avenae]